VPHAVTHAREILGDPTVTESRLRHWIAEGKVRSRKFGGTYAFRLDELAEDLAGKAA
jgi:hypothetical protein